MFITHTTIKYLHEFNSSYNILIYYTSAGIFFCFLATTFADKPSVPSSPAPPYTVYCILYTIYKYSISVYCILYTVYCISISIPIPLGAATFTVWAAWQAAA